MKFKKSHLREVRINTTPVKLNYLLRSCESRTYPEWIVFSSYIFPFFTMANFFTPWEPP